MLDLVVSLGLAYAFVRMTDAPRMPAAAGAPASVRAANHALLIVALLLSGTVALMVGAAINDTTKRTQILYTLLLPAPLLASMSIGLALGPYRIASLIWLVVLLAMAVYLRRFGPRGVTAGLVVFNGGFLGFFLHSEIGLRNIGWIAALLGIGVISSLVVHYALFRKNPTATLERMRRSWEARADRLLDLSIDVLDASDPQHLRSASRRLAQQLVRINESTLLSDAQLAESIPTSAAVEAQRHFNADLALSNIARFADALAGQCRDGPLRAKARTVIAAVLAGDKHDVDARAGDLRHARCDDTRMNVVALRLAASAETYLAARRRIGAAIESAGDKAAEAYEPAVTLSSAICRAPDPSARRRPPRPARGAFDRVVLNRTYGRRSRSRSPAPSRSWSAASYPDRGSTGRC